MKSLRVGFFLGLRAVTRANIGVTALTVLILILANLNLLFVPSLINGIVHTANDKLINTYSGDIIVEADTESRYIRNVDDLAGKIERIDGVSGVAWRNSLTAELSYEEEHTNCVVRSISPQKDRTVFSIADTLIEGRYLEPRETDAILLGVQLSGSDRTELEFYSSSLKTVHAGDKISVAYANGVKKQYVVRGIFATEFLQSDAQAFVTDRELETVNPQAVNHATSIHVKLQNESDESYVLAQISRLRDDITLKTWQETAGIIQSMTGSFDIINGILAAVNLLVAGITVFIVTYIDLVNKRRQIGIERAIGITGNAITISYLFRAVCYALFAIGSAWLLYIYVIMPFEALHPFHFPFGDINLYVDRALLNRSAFIILAASIIASLLPVWHSLRMRILDAIWG